MGVKGYVAPSSSIKQVFPLPQIAFIPNGYYVSLSTSGTRCELMCPFCRGVYLKGMIDASSPSRLKDVLSFLYSKGARGFLLSGGFTRNGYLMISREHLRIVREFRKGKEVIFSMHTGLAPRWLVDEAWLSGVNFLDFEVPPSEQYLAVVKGLRRHSVRDYLEFIDKVTSEYGREFVIPHIIVDSIAAQPSDEVGVMRELSEFKPPLLVVLVEIRSRGLRQDVGRVKRFIEAARAIFNEISLGCMRSQDMKKHDHIFLRSKLVDRVANPKRETIKTFNLPVVYSCCSVPKRFFKLFPSEGLS